MSKIQSLRGMNDLLPAQTSTWQHLEATAAALFRRYGFQEIRFPIMESTELFKRSIGEVTDIVEKEMYTFDDRNGDSVTLRPEGTAGCVRACEQNGLLYNQTQKLWYVGPMFRYERPQKGRLRQFHQIGAECFGFAGPDIDAELIILTARLWRELGLAENIELQLNSLGSNAARQRYRELLVDYLNGVRDQLDEDSQRRISSNPLRVLDSKIPSTQALLKDAPNLLDHLDEESQAHFEGLQDLLRNAGIPFTLNSRLVRGLDYYNQTVFEWVTSDLGAQGTVCGGGRYDGLVEQLGGKATPAVGFAMGLERLVMLLESRGLQTAPTADIYIVAEAEALAYAQSVAEQLRDANPGWAVITHCGGGSFKNQMKKADKSGARVALLCGRDELASEQVTLKHLREEQAQQTLSVAALVAYLAQRL